MRECPSVKNHTEKCVDMGVYDPEILNLYSDEEFEKMDSFIDHDRDFLFTYAGLRQVVDKYLVQDRSSGQVYETPQFMYLLISATIFSKYPKGDSPGLCQTILRRNLKTQNQHSNPHHGRGADTNSSICILCSC